MTSIQSPKPNIIIVDDNLNFRQGLIFLITVDNIANVIGKASDEKEFIELLSYQKPDVALVDINMLQKNGMEAIHKALKMMPDLKIIAFTMFGDEEDFHNMNKLGVKGFLLKSNGIYVIEKAIESVVNGETFVSDQLLNKIIINFTRTNHQETIDNAGLTPVETEIMKLISKGLTNEVIAQKLSLNVSAVKVHLKKLLDKISIQYTSEEAVKASNYILG